MFCVVSLHLAGTLARTRSWTAPEADEADDGALDAAVDAEVEAPLSCAVEDEAPERLAEKKKKKRCRMGFPDQNSWGLTGLTVILTKFWQTVGDSVQ